MIEAPPQEPRELDSKGGVLIELVSRTFATSAVRCRRSSECRCDAAAREIVVVVGPSGCGKIDAAGADMRPAATGRGDGRLCARGADATARPAAAVAVARSTTPRSRCAHAACGASAPGLAPPGYERFGLNEFERTRPAALSGGMRQRISFLRSLLAGKPVLALDEPFAALDAITRAEMQGWLSSSLAAEPRTVVLVTHDVEEAVVLGDRVVVMSPRPGHAVAEIAVALARPRRRTDPERGRVARAGLRARWGWGNEAPR